MTRQRINLRTPLLAYVVRALTLLLGVVLVWYGLMVVLLAVKASPHTVNSISAYRTLYHDAAGLTAVTSPSSTIDRRGCRVLRLPACGSSRVAGVPAPVPRPAARSLPASRTAGRPRSSREPSNARLRSRQQATRE